MYNNTTHACVQAATLPPSSETKAAWPWPGRQGATIRYDSLSPDFAPTPALGREDSKPPLFPPRLCRERQRRHPPNRDGSMLGLGER